MLTDATPQVLRVCVPPAQGQEYRESDEALASKSLGPGSRPGWLPRLRAQRGDRTLPASAGARVAVAACPCRPAPPAVPSRQPRSVPAAARGEAGGGARPRPSPATRSFLEHLCGRPAGAEQARGEPCPPGGGQGAALPAAGGGSGGVAAPRGTRGAPPVPGCRDPRADARTQRRRGRALPG